MPTWIIRGKQYCDCKTKGIKLGFYFWVSLQAGYQPHYKTQKGNTKILGPHSCDRSKPVAQVFSPEVPIFWLCITALL